MSNNPIRPAPPGRNMPCRRCGALRPQDDRTPWGRNQECQEAYTGRIDQCYYYQQRVGAPQSPPPAPPTGNVSLGQRGSGLSGSPQRPRPAPPQPLQPQSPTPSSGASFQPPPRPQTGIPVQRPAEHRPDAPRPAARPSGGGGSFAPLSGGYQRPQTPASPFDTSSQASNPPPQPQTTSSGTGNFTPLSGGYQRPQAPSNPFNSQAQPTNPPAPSQSQSASGDTGNFTPLSGGYQRPQVPANTPTPSQPQTASGGTGNFTPLSGGYQRPQAPNNAYASGNPTTIGAQSASAGLRPAQSVESIDASTSFRALSSEPPPDLRLSDSEVKSLSKELHPELQRGVGSRAGDTAGYVSVGLIRRILAIVHYPLMFITGGVSFFFLLNSTEAGFLVSFIGSLVASFVIYTAIRQLKYRLDYRQAKIRYGQR